MHFFTYTQRGVDIAEILKGVKRGSVWPKTRGDAQNKAENTHLRKHKQHIKKTRDSYDSYVLGRGVTPPRTNLLNLRIP